MTKIQDGHIRWARVDRMIPSVLATIWNTIAALSRSMWREAAIIGGFSCLRQFLAKIADAALDHPVPEN